MSNINDIILFLDIDGVLNDHTKFDNGYCSIQQDKVKIFNSILHKEPIYIVISSAWRYLYHSKSMTHIGFQNLLLSHGVNCAGKLIDFTRPDSNIHESRTNIIKDYIKQWNVQKYFILDDLPILLPNFYHVRNGLCIEDFAPIKELIQKIKNE